MATHIIRGGMQCSLPDLSKRKRALLKCRRKSSGYDQSVELISGNGNEDG
jgi:hypothetical protein